MRYTISSGQVEYGGLRVVVAEAEEALRTARQMEDRGVVGVRISDAEGVAHETAEFGRTVAGHGLTLDQLELIQSTCDVLLSANARAADLFYDELFRIAPETRSLFRNDMGVQKRKLLDTLASMVGQITHPAMFVPLVSKLGLRHAGYGVQPEHYGPVGQALLASLGHLLGDRFTLEVRSAWTVLYLDIADAMIRASSDGSRPTSGRRSPASLPSPD